LILGMKEINNAGRTFQQDEDLEFRQAVYSDMSTVAGQYGSVTRRNYVVNSQYKEICFISNNNPDDLPKELVNAYPAIKAAPVETENNVFLLGNKVYDAFKLDNLKYSFLCLPVKNGNVELQIIGNGEKAAVGPATEFENFADLKEGVTKQQFSLASSDYQLMLNVPKGITVSYPSESRERISIKYNVAPYSIPGMIFLGETYTLEPEGLTFSEPGALVTISYDPNTIRNPNDINVYHFYDGIWHLIPQTTVDEKAHTVSVKLMHFSSLALAVDCGKFSQKDMCEGECEWIGKPKTGFCIPTGQKDDCDANTRLKFTVLDSTNQAPAQGFDIQVDASSNDPFVWVVLKVMKGSSVLFNGGGIENERTTEVGGRFNWRWDSDNTNNVLNNMKEGKYTFEFWKECTNDDCSVPGSTKCIKTELEIPALAAS
jgi:hypothetical protein